MLKPDRFSCCQKIWLELDPSVLIEKVDFLESNKVEVYDCSENIVRTYKRVYLGYWNHNVSSTQVSKVIEV